MCDTIKLGIQDHVYSIVIKAVFLCILEQYKIIFALYSIGRIKRITILFTITSEYIVADTMPFSQSGSAIKMVKTTCVRVFFNID